MIKDLFIYPEEILNETREIEGEAANLALKLSLLSQKIKYIFSKIESLPSIESAEEYFDLLASIQAVLASIVFKYGTGLSDSLHKFVQDFDNLDHDKIYLFQQIKKGKYSS
jgi:hypothetical protein